MDHQQITRDLLSSTQPRHPLRAALEITGRCPNNCVHCYARPLRDMSDMSLDDAKQILDTLKSLGYQSVYIVGGEPMLHPSVSEICTYSHTLGIETILVTNGYQLNTPDLFDKLLPSLDQIEVSIRSDVEQDHNKIASGFFPSDDNTDIACGLNYQESLRSLNSLTTYKGQHHHSSPKLVINIDLYNPAVSRHQVLQTVKNLVDDGITLDGVYLQVISLSGMATHQSLEKVRENFFITRENIIIALNDLTTIREKYYISDVGMTDDPVGHEMTDITDINQLPSELHPLIFGEKIPAIAPNGIIRQNVIKLYFQ